MLRKCFALFVVLAAGFALGACSSFEIPSKKVDYKTTTKLPPLDIPPDLARPGTDDRFVVPDGNPKGTATFLDYNKGQAGKPSGVSAVSTAVLPNVDNVRIDRAGTQRWLVVPGTPEQLWSVVKEFWQETGFVVNVEAPEAGVMETDWSENRAKIPQSGLSGVIGRALDSMYSTSERDKYRTRLERGAQPGTTEIYISHRGMEEIFITEYRDQMRWQPRKPDPDLEAEMLRKLMVRFGVDDSRARTQIAATRTELQAKINRSADGDRLALADPFDRAWRRVGLALDRVGFTVEDRDRSKGVYFVRYIDPDADVKTTEDKGWFSKLKFWDGSSKVQSKEQYRILVREATAGTEVQILDKDGAREKTDTSSRILTLLFDQLK